MSLVRLALRSLLASPFRSALVGLCVALVAGSTVWATLVVQGAQESLRLSVASMERLEADLVVVPRGSGAPSTGGATGNLVSLQGDLAAIPGVAAASPDGTPAVWVQVASGSDPQEVAARILKDIPGVTVFDGASFFRMGRERMASLLRSIPGLLAITWVLSVLFIGLVCAIAVNERRREIGVLRALGATRSFVLRALLAEGLLLALGGGVVGVALSALVSALFRDEIVQSVGLPLVPPTPLALLILAVGSLALAVSSVTLAALFPAWRISRQDPVVAMRG